MMNIDLYLLSVMEMIGIIDIFDFCWVKFLLERPEIFLAEFSLVFSCKCVLHWVLEASLVFFIDGLAGGLGEALSEQILTGCLWDITCISWHMLSFKVLCWSTNPVFSLD